MFDRLLVENVTVKWNAPFHLSPSKYFSHRPVTAAYLNIWKFDTRALEPMRLMVGSKML